MIPSAGVPVSFIWRTHERAEAMGVTTKVIGLCPIATLPSPEATTWKTVPTERVAIVSRPPGALGVCAMLVLVTTDAAKAHAQKPANDFIPHPNLFIKILLSRLSMRELS